MKRLTVCVVAAFLVFGMFISVTSASGYDDEGRAGVPRVVLAELFTSMNCGACPSAEAAMDKLVEDPNYFPKKMVSIEWHPNDNYGNSDTISRYVYYHVQYTPTALFDGLDIKIGGGSTAYSEYKSMIDSRLTNSPNSPVKIEVSAKFGDAGGGDVTVNLTGVAPEIDSYSNTSLYVVVVENINQTISGHVLGYTARDIAAYEKVSVKNGQTITKHYTFSIDKSWDINKLGVVVFLQDEDKVKVDMTVNGRPYYYYKSEVIQSTYAAFPRNKAPVVSSPIGSIQFEEDTQYTQIDLTQVFSDPDGDKLTFGYYGNTHIVVSIDSSGRVILTPQKDWFGVEMITFTAKDAYHSNPVSDTATVNVIAVNDPPEVVHPIKDFSMKEGSEKKGPDLDDVFNDVDSTLTYTFSGNENIQVSIDANHVVKFKASVGFIGTETIIFKADDGEYHITDDVKITVKDVNFPPEVLQGAPTEISMNEDDNETLNFKEIFTDPDDDVLSYSFEGNFYLSISIEGDSAEVTPKKDWYGEETITFYASDGLSDPAFIDITFKVSPINDPPYVSEDAPTEILIKEDAEPITLDKKLDEIFKDVDSPNLEYECEVETNAGIEVKIDGMEILISFQKNWNGMTWIKLTASDGEYDVTHTINVTVSPMNDAPVIVSSQPASTDKIKMDEGDSKKFIITAEDVDGDKISIKWYLDDDEVGEGPEYTYITDKNSSGKHKLVAIVSDGNASVEISWQIIVKNVNTPPTIKVISPTEGSKYKENEKIEFKAEVNDADGDKLTVIWKDNGVEIGRGDNITLILKPGEHVITVEVSDAESTVKSDDITILVEKKSPSGGETPGFGVVVFIIAAIAILLIRWKE